MRKSFTLEYWQDEDWYVGRLQEVPGVFSQGETLEELERNTQEAYSLVQTEGAAVTAPQQTHCKEVEDEV